MSNEKENERISQAVELFRHFITEVTNLDELSEELDSIQLEYSRFLIEDDTEGYKQRSDKLFMLYQLKKICQVVDFNRSKKAA